MAVADICVAASPRAPAAAAASVVPAGRLLSRSGETQLGVTDAAGGCRQAGPHHTTLHRSPATQRTAWPTTQHGTLPCHTALHNTQPCTPHSPPHSPAYHTALHTTQPCTPHSPPHHTAHRIAHHTTWHATLPHSPAHHTALLTTQPTTPHSPPHHTAHRIAHHTTWHATLPHSPAHHTVLHTTQPCTPHSPATPHSPPHSPPNMPRCTGLISPISGTGDLLLAINIKCATTLPHSPVLTCPHMTPQSPHMDHVDRPVSDVLGLLFPN